MIGQVSRRPSRKAASTSGPDALEEIRLHRRLAARETERGLVWFVVGNQRASDAARRIAMPARICSTARRGAGGQRTLQPIGPPAVVEVAVVASSSTREPGVNARRSAAASDRDGDERGDGRYARSATATLG